MKVLTVALLKGGSGKTTTSLALAAVLAEQGRSVVLVDADPQATATMIFGMKPVAEPWAAEPIELYVKELRGGSLTLVRGGRPLRLADQRQREAFFNRPAVQADVMIVDTAPGEIELVDTALRMSDLLLIPIEPSPLSLTGMMDVVELAKRLHPRPPIRCVLTRAHRVRNATRELAERVEGLLPGTLCRTVIPENARVVDAPDFGVPVTLSHRGCRASEAYRELAEELVPVLFGSAPADRTAVPRVAVR
ncbi:MAG: ParA family protein [Dehalococcoidia bacterium]